MRQTTPRPNTVVYLLFLLATGLVSGVTQGMDKPYPGPYFENDRLLVVLRPQAPEAMAAFYEARGFPPAATDAISATCFITVHVENRGRDVIWLDVNDWRFSRHGKPVNRLDRAYWEAQWDRIHLRQASRSTFGWTQFPERRDLQPDEPVGGNLVFPGDTPPFDISLRLPTGTDRRGEPITLEFRDIHCRTQAAPR